MSEESVDNTVTYSRKPGLKMLAFMCVFLVAGIISIVKFDSYFTDFWKIRNCNPEGYERGDFMTACGGIKVDRYAFGSIYLNAQKNAVKNAENADVIVFGNSRTMRSFSTNAIDSYFKDKGLTYMVLASEGAGYKSAILTSEKVKLKPKIILVNSEIFTSDKVSPAFKDLVDFPDKYKTRYDFFNTAQTLHKRVCSSDRSYLKSFYCEGRTRSNWRSATTGRFKWDLIAEPSKQIKFNYKLGFNQSFSDLYTERALELFEMPNYKNSCPVLYLVNSPRSLPELMENMADKMGIQSAFTYMEGLETYDKSHLDRPNSEKWAEEFIKTLDPVIDNCLTGEGKLDVQEPEVFDILTADIEGTSNFETWRTRFGGTIEDKASEAPDKTLSADKLNAQDKVNARFMKVFTDTAVSAGTTMRYGGWFWSEDEGVILRLQIIRSCGTEVPIESSLNSFRLSTKPQRLTIEHTFENNQKCGLVLLSINKPNVSVNAWQGRVEYDIATPE